MSISDPSVSPENWSARVRDVLSRYAEPLLRQVVQRLLKPRNQWPADELLDRSVAALSNAAVIDRRLKELPDASRKLLAVIGLSGQPVWRVGHLVAILAALEHVEGLTPILALVEAGLAHPELPPLQTSLKQFEEWLGPSGIASARLFIHPSVSSRSVHEDLGLPSFPTEKFDSKTVHQSDGFEWLTRTAVAWQRVGIGPVRLTQQQSLFKRDWQRFQTDELLAAPFVDQFVEVPDPGLLALALAISADLIEIDAMEMHSRPAPRLWEFGLAACLIGFWRSLFLIETWDPIHGYQFVEDGGIFPSVALPVFLILRSIPAGKWIAAETIAGHLFARHPSWAATLRNKPEAASQWVRSLLLGIGFPLRLVDAVEESGQWWFRLGDIGKHVLRGDAAPALEHDFRQTLVVQPNGEMVIFRQGLTPGLVGRLTRFAVWKTLGSACTMELTPESVYHGLETGLNLLEIQRLLEQHGTRALPATVLDSLQRWANKRDRITVISAATLMEFTSANDLEAAFAHGLISVKLTDRIGLAASGEEIDYRRLRLIGNRDYEARPQKCLTFDADGVTFSIDTAQSDLLLEAELGRYAEPLPDAAAGQRRFVFTPASLKRGEAQGVSLAELEQWAADRSGEPLSSAARLLYGGNNGEPGRYRRRLVVQLPTETIANGVVQWPVTGKFVEERLGPCAITVAETNLPALIESLAAVGIELQQALTD
jgi:hypothetical protein